MASSGSRLRQCCLVALPTPCATATSAAAHKARSSAGGRQVPRRLAVVAPPQRHFQAARRAPRSTPCALLTSSRSRSQCALLATNLWERRWRVAARKAWATCFGIRQPCTARHWSLFATTSSATMGYASARHPCSSSPGVLMITPAIPPLHSRAAPGPSRDRRARVHHCGEAEVVVCSSCARARRARTRHCVWVWWYCSAACATDGFACAKGRCLQWGV